MRPRVWKVRFSYQANYLPPTSASGFWSEWAPLSSIIVCWVMWKRQVDKSRLKKLFENYTHTYNFVPFCSLLFPVRYRSVLVFRFSLLSSGMTQTERGNYKRGRSRLARDLAGPMARYLLASTKWLCNRCFLALEIVSASLRQLGLMFYVPSVHIHSTIGTV